MRRPPSWKIYLLMLLVVAGRLSGEVISAEEMAQRALEGLRKDDDRKLTTLMVPPGKEMAGLPEGAEVYLIRGYINYQCARIFIREGKAVAQVVKMSRTWFYSPKEDYSAEEWEIAEGDFAKAWEAIRLIQESDMPRKQTPESTGAVRLSRIMGSHDPTFYVRVWSNASAAWEKAVRDITIIRGVQNFENMQTRAMVVVLENLIPKEGTGKPFALREWGPFLTQQLADCEILLQDSPFRLDKETTLLLETSLRLLGQMGYEPARTVILAVEDKAMQAPPKAPWADEVLRETGYARQKIAIQAKFNPSEVGRMIHEHRRTLNPDRDFVQWLRDQYFAEDAEGYFALLAEDMRNPGTSEAILLESIADLQKRYPKSSGPSLEGVLGNASSEVAVQAALALLNADANHDDALKTLTRVAADAHASIPEEVHWSNHFGRERALDYLAAERSPVTPEYRWDAARIEQQLSLPREDGRMINRLISIWYGLTNKPMPDSQQIAAYRKALAEPYNMGTVNACSELIKLRDQASAKQIQEVMKELLSGCNRRMAWEEDPEAKYPWIRQSEIEQVERRLWDLLASN